MSDLGTARIPLTWPKALLFIAGAVACFHLAYWSAHDLHFLIVGYIICLVQLSRLPTTRRAFYAGLVTAILCVAPQLTCFWKIFGPAAIVLWCVLAFWIAAFTAMISAALRRFGPMTTAVLVPFLWMGLEYFRSELYYLKFSWMNVGYAFSGVPFRLFGMYGAGFMAAICAALFLITRRGYALIGTACLTLSFLILSGIEFAPPHNGPVQIAGVQMEFPPESDIGPALDSVIQQYTNADIVVLSEYTLDGPVPESLKDWCHKNHRYLVIGGKDFTSNNNFYDTAFVVGPEGDIVFRQGKTVPIQFFKDGLPAPTQEVWNSPWGKIGFCVCYDLSYTRVIDALIKKGAQLIIVPTMDVVDWGVRQHQLHALVAPVRASEYGIPIFRLASSGISQAVDSRGRVLATAPFAGEGKALFASLKLPDHGLLPPDRNLALVSVAITAIVLVILCMPNRKRKIPVTIEIGNSANQQAREVPTPT